MTLSPRTKSGMARSRPAAKCWERRRYDDTVRIGECGEGVVAKLGCRVESVMRAKDQGGNGNDRDRYGIRGFERHIR